jgi:hypothetical protein
MEGLLLVLLKNIVTRDLSTFQFLQSVAYLPHLRLSLSSCLKIFAAQFINKIQLYLEKASLFALILIKS